MACNRYELNMTGARFGDCKCGHGKAEHSQESLHAGPAPHPPAAPKAEEKHAAAPAGSDYHGPCDNYTVDLQATEFGLCKCGFKKPDHGKPKEMFMHKPEAPAIPQSRAPAPAPSPSPPPAEPEPQAPPAPASSGHPKSENPCSHFEIDITGTFGFCKCGHSREEHKAAGTLAEPEPRLFAGGHIGDAKRATIAQKPGAHPGKQAKPCDNYQVDMNGKTFGDCLCGHAKAKHKQFQAAKKVLNNDPDEEEAVPEPEPAAPKPIIRDGSHPCEKFELDLKNTGGYGHCLCGFSRLDHEQFHHDPDEWHKVRAALTAPKEFT